MTKKNFVEPEEELIEDVTQEDGLTEPEEVALQEALRDDAETVAELDAKAADEFDAAILKDDSPALELVRVRANRSFRDGVFKADFEAWGYKKETWDEGEVRTLPLQVYAKLQQRSGKQFSLVA